MTRLNDRNRNAVLLLIEDNPGDILLFRRAAERCGLHMDLIVARSAEEALLVLRDADTARPGSCPDLVLLDLNLPHMSGLDFLDIIKKDPERRRIPVLIFSSSTSDADIAACYDRHANGYLSKPMGDENYETILATLESYWFGLMQIPTANGESMPGWRDVPHALKG